MYVTLVPLTGRRRRRLSLHVEEEAVITRGGGGCHYTWRRRLSSLDMKPEGAFDQHATRATSTQATLR
jgi:hypothetical protein